MLQRRGIPHTIAERADQRVQRKPCRKPTFCKETYRRRNVVERSINRLKEWRGIATRFDKHRANYRAMVVITSPMVWLGQ